MARSKNHKPGLSPGEGLTYTPSNDATYTEAFNDYLKKRNINRNQAIGELLTIALQTLKDSYDLPDPTAVHYMNNQVPIYPTPNLINRSIEQSVSASLNTVEKPDSSPNQFKEEDSSNAVPLNQKIEQNENKRKVLSDFINTVSNEENPKRNALDVNSGEQIKSSASEKPSNNLIKNSTDINDLALMLKGME
ncbi:hypothetical protein [Exiguobacterium artemiae]|uniref:hypothetical protein n=1 Tax=Exiguobacterium artemiae TaxID=340145 RepID=UPI00047C7E1C|nr:hypothetical protein [Exiguobacterium sibiricum]